MLGHFKDDQPGHFSPYTFWSKILFENNDSFDPSSIVPTEPLVFEFPLLSGTSLTWDGANARILKRFLRMRFHVSCPDTSSVAKSSFSVGTEDYASAVPADVWMMILAYLSVADLLALRVQSQKFCGFVNDFIGRSWCNARDAEVFFSGLNVTLSTHDDHNKMSTREGGRLFFALCGVASQHRHLRRLEGRLEEVGHVLESCLKDAEVQAEVAKNSIEDCRESLEKMEQMKRRKNEYEEAEKEDDKLHVLLSESVDMKTASDYISKLVSLIELKRSRVQSYGGGGRRRLSNPLVDVLASIRDTPALAARRDLDQSLDPIRKRISDCTPNHFVDYVVDFAKSLAAFKSKVESFLHDGLEETSLEMSQKVRRIGERWVSISPVLQALSSSWSNSVQQREKERHEAHASWTKARHALATNVRYVDHSIHYAEGDKASVKRLIKELKTLVKQMRVKHNITQEEEANPVHREPIIPQIQRIGLSSPVQVVRNVKSVPESYTQFPDSIFQDDLAYKVDRDVSGLVVKILPPPKPEIQMLRNYD